MEVVRDNVTEAEVVLRFLEAEIDKENLRAVMSHFGARRRTKYMVAERDEVIPPDAERQFAQCMGATTIELASGDVAMVSHADDVIHCSSKRPPRLFRSQSEERRTEAW